MSQIKKGSKFLSTKFKKINQPFIGGKVTNAMLIKMNSSDEVEKVKKYMRKNKIYVRTNFKNEIKNFFRISLGSERCNICDALTFESGLVNLQSG